MNNPIIERCAEWGVDHARLKSALDSHDRWGKLVHSAVYLIVLAAVLEAMEKEAA